MSLKFQAGTMHSGAGVSARDKMPSGRDFICARIRESARDGIKSRCPSLSRIERGVLIFQSGKENKKGGVVLD